MDGVPGTDPVRRAVGVLDSERCRTRSYNAARRDVGVWAGVEDEGVAGVVGVNNDVRRRAETARGG